jgi:hypothetical protein
LVGSAGGDLAVVRIFGEDNNPIPITTADLNGINGFEINGNQPSGTPPVIATEYQINLDIDGGVAMGDTWNILRTDWLTINGRPTTFIGDQTGTVIF